METRQHLRAEAGLNGDRRLDVEPRAQQRLYGLRGDRLRDLNKWLERYRAIWEGAWNNWTTWFRK